MRLRFLPPYLIALLMLCGLVLPLQAKAASSDSSISVDIAPPNPNPNENVTITLNSYTSNLDSVSISWFVNGKAALSGIGKKSFLATAPNAGSTSAIVAKIALPDGEIDENITLKPSVMVLLWQATDSYVPPFYRGKALPTAGSAIKVVAMPEVRNSSGILNPANMTYAWQKDYTNDVEDSGYGKNSLTFTDDYLESSNSIQVTASTLDQTSSSDASIQIGTINPKIDFYKNDSALGIMWDSALTDGYKVQGSEIIEAIPYFISPKNLFQPSLVWNWSINDSSIHIPSFKKNAIPVTAQAGVSGASKIDLEIENSDKIFETASKELNVTF